MVDFQSSPLRPLSEKILKSLGYVETGLTGLFVRHSRRGEPFSVKFKKVTDHGVGSLHGLTSEEVPHQQFITRNVRLLLG